MTIGNDPANIVETYLQSSAETTRQTAQSCGADILRAAAMIRDCFKAGGKLMLCGNGGSAADCQHMATEFVSRLSKDIQRPGLPALALTTDTSFLTAFANDFDYEGIFARQVQALGKPDDVLLGISTSGRSANVIKAVAAAKQLNISVIALTGNEGTLAAMGDVAISVPSGDTQHIQEAHLAIEHVLCQLVESDLYSAGRTK
ncbi:MAG: SIS domain-containing protein [Chloroflexi bacterium]|nr:SIS domain-containing protein [Chloroflexota bacterium]